MSRALAIAAVVLVPFAGLVALGFSLLGEPPPFVLPIDEPRPLPPPPPPTPPPPPQEPVGPPPLPVEIAVRAPAQPPAGPVEPARVSEESRRAPMLAAVEPLVQQCFKDASDRLREPMRVTVAFDTTAQGGFEGVVLKGASWRDPQLSACVIDAFEDARFEPSGLVTRRRTHTFSFGVDAGQ